MPHPGPRLSPGGKFFPCSAAMSLWFGAQGGVGLPDQVSTAPWLGRLWFCLQRGWGNAPCEGGCRALTARSSSDQHSAPTMGLKRAQNSQEPHPLSWTRWPLSQEEAALRRGWHLNSDPFWEPRPCAWEVPSQVPGPHLPAALSCPSPTLPAPIPCSEASGVGAWVC